MSEAQVVKELEDIDAMFVHTARGFAVDGERIVLRDVTPSTLYFGDRPERVVGHVDTAEFVDLWGESEDSSRPVRRTPCWRSAEVRLRRPTSW